jgi:hypothetical protein
MVVVVRDSGYRSRGPGFDSRRCHIFWDRGLLSLVSTSEELRERKSSNSGLEKLEYGRRDPSSWPCDTLYPQHLALTSLTRERPLGRYSSLADWGHGVYLVVCLCEEKTHTNHSGENFALNFPTQHVHLEIQFPNYWRKFEPTAIQLTEGR